MRRLFAVGVLVLSSITWSQTTRPGTGQPVDTGLLDKGLSALQEKSYAQAKDVLLQASTAVPKNVRLTEDDHVLTSEALGDAYLGLHDYAKAAPYLEAAFRSGKNSRSLTLNTAWAHLQTGAFARSLVILDAFLQKNPTDETALNMMGVVLNAASEKSQAGMGKYAADYDKYNAQLEAEHARQLATNDGTTRIEETSVVESKYDATRQTRTTQHSIHESTTRPSHNSQTHHWGTQWLTDREYQSMQSHVRSIQHRIDSLQLDLTKARNDLIADQREAETARKRDLLYGRTTTWPEQSFYQRRIESTQHRIDRIGQDIAHEAGEMPKPQWVDTFEPLPPDIHRQAK